MIGKKTPLSRIFGARAQNGQLSANNSRTTHDKRIYTFLESAFKSALNGIQHDYFLITLKISLLGTVVDSMPLGHLFPVVKNQ